MAMRRRDAVSEVLNVARISPTDVARSQIQGSRSRHSGEIYDGFLSLARVSSRKYDLLLAFVNNYARTSSRHPCFFACSFRLKPSISQS